MRLILSTTAEPQLLVTVNTEEYNTCKEIFDFYVINGAWDGNFNKGTVYVYEKDTYHGNVVVLCDNQDDINQLGNFYDYNSVLNNYKG